ncbi:MAG: cytochrome c5 family protein [Polynucleobacter sp. 24-46-87]|jgi:cytochrome c5|uniref:c-type cytochrome n=1 Tax=Polynucleobacter sp. 39-46-10 TaxID=1970428 RepID=UPI000BDA0EC8|nr:c-type cytochrome [Polynucleobacter sp. 39-46-10]OZA12438.1 MAG: cytochrome c5 family protein [Polynucleobacter sp. 24-46-87]OZA74880.1 MAG: cytochrome c5 family protein [Polynucleobacter sp. 39-46-10]
MPLKPILLAFILFAASQLCFADGQKTYQEVCSVCHTAGVANAPKLGDQNAWKKLIGEGQVIITAHGYVGVRAMPPKGGRQDLSVEQFSEALNYMVNKSGGNWSTPDKPMLDKINNEIASRKKTQ